MPITSYPSYVSTMQSFIAHWTQVNTALGVSPLLLKSGFTIANFTTERTNIQTAITAVEDFNNLIQLASNDKRSKKETIKPRLQQFRGAVKNTLQGTVYERALPTQPKMSDSEGKFMRALDDMASLWTRINADTTIPGFTPPLLLIGAYAIATFNTDVTALRTSYANYVSALKNAEIARARRNVLLPPALLHMKQYKSAVFARLPAADPLCATIPNVYPPPGSTPQAVIANGVWVSATLKAHLAWTTSTDTNLLKYEVRYSAGSPYDANEAILVGFTLPGVTTFDTNTGLSDPGFTASYKIFVITDTLNERGSNAVTIMRPTI